MPRTPGRQAHIVVADPRPRDYRRLAELAGDFGWHVHLLTTGSAALQFARRNAADLWMVSSQLADVPWGDLLEMLRDLSCSGPVFVVGNRYDADEERRACILGAGLYVCKDARQTIDCQIVVGALANRGPPAQVVRVVSRAVG